MRNRSTTLLGAAVVATAAALALKQLADGDVWFHLAYGRELLARRGFPPGEPFVAPLLGQGDGRSPGWLFAVLLRAAEAAAGLPGVSIFVSALVAATFLVLFLDRPAPAAAEQDTPALAIHAAVLGLGAVLMRERFQPRPEIAAYLFVAVLGRAIHRHEEGHRRALLLCPPMFVVWANVHPSEAVGLGLLGLHSLACLATHVVRRAQRRPLVPGELGHAILPFAVTAICGVATFVSPTPGAGLRGALEFFTGLLGHSTGLASGPGLALFATEVAPPGRDDFFGLYGAFLAIVALSLVAGARRLRASGLARAAAACLASLVAARFIALAPLVCAPIVARNLAELARQRRARSALAFGLLACLPLAARQVDRFADERFGLGRMPNRFPEGGLAFLMHHGIDGPLYHTLHFGGYVAWRAFPRLAPFHDSRRPAGWHGPDSLLAELDPDAFRRLDERFHFGEVLLEMVTFSDEDATRRLRRGERDLGFSAPGWVLVHFDDAAGVYLDARGAHARLVERLGYRCLMPANGLEALSRRMTDPEAAPACLEEARRAVGEAPGAALPRLLLARALSDTGALAEADAELALARELALAPVRVRVDFERARLAWLRSEALHACVIAERHAVAEVGGREALLAGTACLTAHPDQPDRARPWLERAMAADHELLGAYNALGAAGAGADPRFLHGLGLLAARHQADPDFRRANSLFSERKPLDAAASLRAALATDTHNVLAYSNLGMALLDAGQPREAAAALQRALSLDPFCADAEYGLALALERLGQPDLTAARLRRFLVLRPEGPWAERARAKLAQTK